MFMTGEHRGYCLDPYKRQFRAAPPVSTIGFSPRNTMRTDAVHRKLDVCFILRGAGFLQVDRRRYPVKAPCVMTIAPGLRTRHGPKVDWDEVYISYHPPAIPALVGRRLVMPEQPVWPIANLSAIERGLMNLKESLQELHAVGGADVIDWLCAGLILQSRIRVPPPADQCPSESALQALRAHLEVHYREPLDLRRLAKAHGLSYSHFFRLWGRRFTWPPYHYLMSLRIGEACRLLSETTLRMNEIAGRVGFNDPYHFSKRFRQMTGETASAYRRMHRESARAFRILPAGPPASSR